MSDTPEKSNVVSYKFHHIDHSKCAICKDFSCEDACFRGIYKVINKDTKPMSVIVEEREDHCIKCHICTTACKLRAITID